MNDLKKMSELELIKLFKDKGTSKNTSDAIYEILLKKYEPMIGKHWFMLRSSMENSLLILETKDDFYSEACMSLLKVLEKVDISRIYDENFKLMQLYSWYLNNLRNKFRKEVLKKAKIKGFNNMNQETEEGDLVIDLDVEQAYWEREGYKHEPSYIAIDVDGGEEMCQRAIKNCMNKWPVRERTIFNYLREGKSRNEIAALLEVTPIKMWNIINRMKRDMKKELGII